MRMGTVDEGPCVDGRRNGHWVIPRYGAGSGSIAGFASRGIYEGGERNGFHAQAGRHGLRDSLRA